MNYYQLVREFHEAFVPEVVTDSPVVLSEERHELRMRLIREEWIETLKAYHYQFHGKCDMEALLDGLCDLVYVFCGYVVEGGMYQYPYENKLHPSSPLKEIDFVSEIGKGISLIDRDYYTPGCSENSMANTFALIIEFGYYFFGKDSFDKAFEEVHASNMAKLWNQEDIDYYYDNNLVDVIESLDIIDAINNPGHFVAKRKDGNIMKPPSWTPPNLKQFL